MSERRRQSVDVLLVDPNDEDVRLFRDSLQSEKITNRIHVVATGADALDFLHRRGDHTDAPRPDMILLEVELPEMDGKDILEELDGHEELRGIPVIVLTKSDEEEDVVKSYKLHANAYIQKPVDSDKFLQVVRTLEQFWIEVVRLPDTEDDDDALER